jgi:hypothetical protein
MRAPWWLLGCVLLGLWCPVEHVVAASAFHPQPLLAGTKKIIALERASLLEPERYRVIVIPGSGCTGLAPIADRYFAGLTHARVLVLHKPGVNPAWWPAPRSCPYRFVATDSLESWRDAASVALSEYLQKHPSDLPLVLVGISEGAELLPHLATKIPGVSALVIIGSSGLDPAAVAALQAQRLGQLPTWQSVVDLARGSRAGTQIVQGRTLRYWREMLAWRMEDLLANVSLPLMQLWGGHDASVPVAAYEQGSARLRARAAPYCGTAFEAADHGLQEPGHDHLQWAWARLENWSRGGQWCASWWE